jgi:hypothetical protein
MDNVIEVVALLRKHSELELQIRNGSGGAVDTEQELEAAVRRLALFQRTHRLRGHHLAAPFAAYPTAPRFGDHRAAMPFRRVVLLGGLAWTRNCPRHQTQASRSERWVRKMTQQRKIPSIAFPCPNQRARQCHALPTNEPCRRHQPNSWRRRRGRYDRRTRPYLSSRRMIV